MNPLTAADVWSLAGYETQRDAFRREIIALKKIRRVPLGPRATLVFENHNTLLFQVQEMLRVEHLSDPAAIQAELDVYNELLPSEACLSATLFIEITDLADIRPELDRLIGLDEHVYLRVGSETIRATFDAGQMEEDRISAVHYLRFPMGDEARRAFLDEGRPALLGIDHPNYIAEIELEGATRASLLNDLTGATGLLLAPPPESTGEEVELFREGSARAARPAAPADPGHVVVEPLGPSVAFLDATPEQHAACAAAIRRVVSELGPHRVESRAGANAALRFDLFPER
ncbi:MAG: DUF3501 family protein [Deltaproteobacteria bacterium]|nr:DUF3501 family protein [Deltaproteobacteria bacterium]MBW2447384.1 DUF3501 family protein [Deltaproteobacteria bacterium]